MKSLFLGKGLFLLCCVLVAGQAVTGPELVYEYKVGPRDLLEISVIGFDEVNKQYRVSEEGKISLPYLGEIEVRGLTRSELEKRLVQLLKDNKLFMQNPQVTVTIAEYQSRRVYLLGAVGTGGPYELLGRMTLLRLLSVAGGLTPEAGNEIIITRQLADGNKTTLKISVDDLMLKGDARLDVPLQPDDIVNVPVDAPIPIYVTGRVRTPGVLQVKRSTIPTLLRAIAQAGGFDERASKGNVIIKRTDEAGKEVQIKVNAGDIEKGKIKDVPLLEGDIIIVRERFI